MASSNWQIPVQQWSVFLSSVIADLYFVSIQFPLFFWFSILVVLYSNEIQSSLQNDSLFIFIELANRVRIFQFDSGRTLEDQSQKDLMHTLNSWMTCFYVICFLQRTGMFSDFTSFCVCTHCVCVTNMLWLCGGVQRRRNVSWCILSLW